MQNMGRIAPAFYEDPHYWDKCEDIDEEAINEEDEEYDETDDL